MQRSFQIQKALKREKLKRLTPAQIFLASGGGSGQGGGEPVWRWADGTTMKWADGTAIKNT